MVTEHLTLKPDGSWWRVLYGGGTIRWVPTESPLSDDTGASPPQSPLFGGGSPLRGGGGPLQAIESVAHVAGEVGQWWELRQQRLLMEAVHEQSQRIDWLTDIMGRWADVHRGGGQLDLRISEYLARESRAFVDIAASNKRVALPQSLLYELDLIQDSFRSMRGTLADQFEALVASDEERIKEAVRLVLPGRTLNMDFIRRVAMDPSTAWAEKVRGKSAAAFDAEFADAFRFPDVFRDHLFSSNEVAVHEPLEPTRMGGFLDRITALVVGSLPWLRWEDMRADLGDKRDAFRELVLLPAEIFRVRALYAAWVATSAVVTEASGDEVGVLLGSNGIAIQLGLTTPELPSRDQEMARERALAAPDR